MKSLKINIHPHACLYNSFVATFDDYDGAPDANYHPIGQGCTEKDAVIDLIDDWIESGRNFNDY